MLPEGAAGSGLRFAHFLKSMGRSLEFARKLGTNQEGVAKGVRTVFDPASKGRVCEAGLWHYSRHPNYFFEWLIWVAYFVFALASPWGWAAVIGPASILFLLLRVTGIPLTEEQSLRSKGDAYRRYQQTTSAFVPCFPKKLP